jgi:hypothetical protein
VDGELRCAASVLKELKIWVYLYTDTKAMAR